MRKFLLFITVVLLSSVLAFSQSKPVSGKILDESGQPVSGASVTIKGSKAGKAASSTGDFIINAKDGDVLVVTATGFQPMESRIKNNQTNVSLTLTRSSNTMTEVVVTAFGIKRSVKSTPFAVQQIDAARLTQTRETDLTSALSGKIAGLQTVGQAGAKLGSSGQVRLRGVSGFDDKSAIYVVDGTIVENASDINMDDVASVSVLKGPNATALYGQRADGGVIVITSKKAVKSKSINVQFNSTTTLEKVAVLPQYQDKYGGGSGNNAFAEVYHWKTGDPEEWKALDGYNRPTYFDDASWGPAFDGGDYIPWYAWYGGHSRSYKPAKWVAEPDNIRDFYQTGITANNNISLSKGGDKYLARFGYTNLQRTGIIPESKLSKNFLSTQLSYDITNHFTVGTNIGVTFENFKGDAFDQYGNSTTGSFNQWFHRDLDMGIMKELRGLKGPDGTFASWNIDDQAGMTANSLKQPIFWYNPYTWLDNLDQRTKRFRLLGDASLTYKLNSNFKITGTYRLNYRTTDLEVKIPYILEQSSGTAGYTYDEVGNTIYNKYRHNNTKYREANYELIAQYNKQIKDFTLDFLIGGNILNIKRDDSTRTTSGGLTVADVYQIGNSKSAAGLGATLSYRQVNSAFYRGTIGYKNYLFADFSGRYDKSSTLPVLHDSYFNPSAGVSFIFSEFTKNWKPLSYGKLRLSFANIGNDPLDPYQSNFTFQTGAIPFAGTDSLVAVPNVLIDPNLKAPSNTSYEAGIDVKFFRDRIGGAFTVYREVRKNEIVTTDISPSSGYDFATINAGRILRKGVELELNAKPVMTKNFTWNMSVNWATNKTTIEDVSPTTDLTTISSLSGQKYTLFYAIKGREWGVIQAPGIKRLNGLPVLNIDGTYAEAEAKTDFGNILPRYTGGVFNSFTFKGITLSATVDFQKGGKYLSLSDFYGKQSGLTKETAAMNDRGKNVRDAVSDGGGVHVYGVLADGKPYDTYVDAFTYFKQTNSNTFYDLSIFDMSYIKLREVSFGYDLPVKKWGNFIKSAYISLVARNIWLIYTKNRNIDPSELGNRYQEDGQMPGTKSLGLNLKFNF